MRAGSFVYYPQNDGLWGGGMQKRFAGILLLLGFVAINLVMFLMLVTSMTGKHHWLSHVLPGQFEYGGNSSGYWVFFALVLLVDAITVLIAGFVLLIPGMREGAALNEQRIARHLVDRGGVSEEAKESIFVALREECLSAHYQIVVGRMILAAGVVFLVFAFFAVSLKFARALPDGQMFSVQCLQGRVLCDQPTNLFDVKNSNVTTSQVEMFTVDQLAGAALVGAPEVYDWHFGTLVNNPKNTLFTNFVFAFRALTSLVLLLIVISLFRRPQRPSREKKTIQSVEAAAEENKA